MPRLPLHSTRSKPKLGLLRKRSLAGLAVIGTLDVADGVGAANPRKAMRFAYC